MKPAFGCLFERFPSFTQTFVAREAEALRGLGVETALYSVRAVSDEAIRHFPETLVSATTVLPKADEVAAEVMEMKRRDELPPHAVVTLRQWGARPDKNRVYEALWRGRGCMRRECGMYTRILRGSGRGAAGGCGGFTG